MLRLSLAGITLFTLACASSEPPPGPPQKPVAANPVVPGAPRVEVPLRTVDEGFAGIRATGKLRVAADPDASPFLLKTASGYEGFEYALMSSLASSAGAELVIVPAKFDELPGRLLSGEADLAIGQVSPSASYEGLAFSVSYLQYSMCLVVPAASPVKSLAELKGKRIGMYDDPVARQLADVLVSASYERVLFDDYGYFEKMVRGQLDAMVYDCPLARHELKTYGDQLKVVDDALNIATYAVAMPAGRPKLLADVNAAVKHLGEQGLLASLEQRWLGQSGPAESYESATGKVVIVKKGESLSAIAERELGDVERWRVIYDANKDVVGPDPNEIYVGMRLRLPR